MPKHDKSHKSNEHRFSPLEEISNLNEPLSLEPIALNNPDNIIYERI
jgi:hypothetical protein